MTMQRFHIGMLIAIGTFGLIMSVYSASLLSAYQRVPNVGVVKAVGVGVYKDSRCSVNITSIDWGLLEPGAKANFTIYIRNEGNIPLILNITTASWDPENASMYISLLWNLESRKIDPSEVVQATLTLSISPDIEGITSFRFEIFIVGREAS